MIKIRDAYFFSPLKKGFVSSLDLDRFQQHIRTIRCLIPLLPLPYSCGYSKVYKERTSFFIFVKRRIILYFFKKNMFFIKK